MRPAFEVGPGLCLNQWLSKIMIIPYGHTRDQHHITHFPTPPEEIQTQ